MREEADAMMVVRAELCERLAMMQSLSKRASIRDLAVSITAFRSIAAAYGLSPVVRLAEALERAMADEMVRGAQSRSAALYLDRLYDAIGCTRLDEGASEALLASVSVRLNA